MPKQKRRQAAKPKTKRNPQRKPAQRRKKGSGWGKLALALLLPFPI